LRANKKLLLVGRDGIGYEPTEWDTSHIYWNGNQDNLLVSDNMTRQYEFASPEGRNKLSDIAWTPDYFPLEMECWEDAANSRYYAKKIRGQQDTLREIDASAENANVRLVIYGAGVLEDFFYKWLRTNTPNITINAVVDTYMTATVYTGEQVFAPRYLVENITSYEYIVMSSNKFYKESYEQLLVMKIDPLKII